MQGYYDYGPLVDLRKPVALAGYLTEETRVVGYRLAALLGLPSIDLDRRIEHQSGRSVWSLVWDESEARYRQLERQELRRAVRERPCGILSLGDGTLMDEENRPGEYVLATESDRDTRHGFLASALPRSAAAYRAGASLLAGALTPLR